MASAPSPSAPAPCVRAFVAVELGADVRQALREALAALQRLDAPVRWVPESNWHLTLKFLGDVDGQSTGALGLAVREVAAARQPFTLAVRGLRAFPPERAPRLIAAGVGGETAALEALHRALEARLEEFGTPPERRPFHAHLTLGRLQGTRGLERLWKRLAPLADAPFGQFQVETLVLYRSELKPRGAEYTPLASGRLSG